MLSDQPLLCDWLHLAVHEGEAAPQYPGSVALSDAWLQCGYHQCLRFANLLCHVGTIHLITIQPPVKMHSTYFFPILNQIVATDCSETKPAMYSQHNMVKMAPSIAHAVGSAIPCLTMAAKAPMYNSRSSTNGPHLFALAPSQMPSSITTAAREDGSFICWPLMILTGNRSSTSCWFWEVISLR